MMTVYFSEVFASQFHSQHVGQVQHATWVLPGFGQTYFASVTSFFVFPPNMIISMHTRTYEDQKDQYRRTFGCTGLY